MAAKKGSYQIPFEKNGDQITYADYYYVKNGMIDFRDNFEFEDTLTYSSYSRGRSAANFDFKRSDGSNVVIFMTDMNKLIPLMVRGRVAGRWTFVKKGQNYGCMRIGDAAPVIDTDGFPEYPSA